MSPSEAVKAAKILNAKYNLSTHYQTFDLFFDGYNDAKNILQRKLEREENKNLNFATLDFGEGKTWE